MQLAPPGTTVAAPLFSLPGLGFEFYLGLSVQKKNRLGLQQHIAGIALLKRATWGRGEGFPHQNYADAVRTRRFLGAIFKLIAGGGRWFEQASATKCKDRLSFPST